jgi:tRNA uridine 5-carboxymethylaminomethyl modification enzyme
VKVPNILVIGAGHAGIEAASASARLGARVSLATLDLKTVGRMSCNPAIGGIAKGNLVAELDALGGVMGRAADACGIQFRVLNRSRGPAVWGLRAQEDRAAYARWMRKHLASLPGVVLREGMAVRLLVDGGQVRGALLADGSKVRADAVVITAGTFLNGLIHIGTNTRSGGRVDEPAATGLSESLRDLGLSLGRFKTGTPPRVLADSAALETLPSQHGDSAPLPFSLYTRCLARRQMPCHLTWTTPDLHDFLREHLPLSPLHSGQITGTGPRYCPSLEVKVTSFPGRERHPVFVEPEGRRSRELYLNGLSMSLPPPVQERIVRMLPGFEAAVISRWAYAIEYDMVFPDQITPTLQVRALPGLFLAGQINGTSGYEEAAAQGLLAGINAMKAVQGEEPVVLGRERAYMGILVDDLVRTRVREPYRMFTSRAEYRLQLGFRTARRRLLPLGRALGLMPDPVFQRAWAFEERVGSLVAEAEAFPVTPSKDMLDRLKQEPELRLEEATTLAGLYFRTRRPLASLAPLLGFPCRATAAAWSRAEEEILYAPYRARQEEEVERMKSLWKTPIPQALSFIDLPGLSREAMQRLTEARPRTIGEARVLPGMTPAALSALYVAVTLHAQGRKP